MHTALKNVENLCQYIIVQVVVAIVFSMLSRTVILSQAMNGRRCVLAFSGSTILGATKAAAASRSDE